MQIFIEQLKLKKKKNHMIKNMSKTMVCFEYELV